MAIFNSAMEPQSSAVCWCPDAKKAAPLESCLLYHALQHGARQKRSTRGRVKPHMGVNRATKTHEDDYGP